MKKIETKDYINYALSFAGIAVTVALIVKPEKIEIIKNEYFVPMRELVQVEKQEEKVVTVTQAIEEVKKEVSITPVSPVVQVRQTPKTVVQKAVEEVSQSTTTEVKLVNINGVTVDERYADVVRQQMLDAMVQKQQAEDLLASQKAEAKRLEEEKAFQEWYNNSYLKLKEYAEYLMSTDVQEYHEEANRKFYGKPIPTIDNYKTW